MSNQLPLCLSGHPVQQSTELKGTLVTSYHIMLGQMPPSPPLVPPQKTYPVEEQPTSTAPLTQAPKQSPRPKRWHPSLDPMESMPLVEPL